MTNKNNKNPRRPALFAAFYTVLACVNSGALYHFLTRNQAGWAVFCTVSLIASIGSVAIRIYEVGEGE